MDPSMLLSMAMMRQGGDASTYIMLLVILLPFLSKYIMKHIKTQKQTCVRLTQTYNYKNGACIEVFCTPKYSAVNHFVINFLTNHPQIPHQIIYTDHIKDSQVIMNYFSHGNITIQQEIDEVQDSNEKKDTFKSKDYIYVITSADGSMKTIHNFITECEEEYTNFTNKISDKCYILSKNCFYRSAPFYATKTFDNMFFTQKQDLIACLDNFTNNEDEYKRLGIPYTLGLMFHGQPGCGKTTAIKAIARYTKRTIIKIPANRIKTIDQLHSFFESEFINSLTLPIKTSLCI
jgi:ABC-type multidrug transport system fused ATPase/permease subunit